MKSYLFTLVSILLSLSLSAQVSIEGWETLDGPMAAPRDTLDKAALCVHYDETVVPDTLSREDTETYQMFLQIGNKITQYGDYINFLNDSIMYTQIAQNKDRNEIFMGMMSRLNTKTKKECVIKNLSPGKITVTDFLFADYRYDEDMPEFNWKQVDGEEMTILGYPCHKAICSFRGRNYTAWYTPDVPVNNGPWKFSGLPGLILKVSDDKNEYVFEVVAIYQPSWISPICRKIGEKEMVVSRKQYQKLKHRMATDPRGFISSLPEIVEIKGGSPAQAARRRPYNPIELD